MIRMLCVYLHVAWGYLRPSSTYAWCTHVHIRIRCIGSCYPCNLAHAFSVADGPCPPMVHHNRKCHYSIEQSHGHTTRCTTLLDAQRHLCSCFKHSMCCCTVEIPRSRYHVV
ncbi:hypothetical protein F4808DRAFT_101231 [Astrocystis sublimbata]|nr:hypothetical protein F4808DRAFT_101231 [Astrocystis sublimbata]